MNDRMTITEAFAAMASYGPAVWLGVLAAVVTFVIEIVLCTKGILFSGGEQKLKRARQAGNVVLGTLKHYRYKDREPEGKTANRLYIGIYEYTVDGITRTKRLVVSGMKPPHTLYFYYISNPKHVFSEYDTGKNPLMILLYIIPILVAFLVATALGFRP